MMQVLPNILQDKHLTIFCMPFSETIPFFFLWGDPLQALPDTPAMRAIFCAKPSRFEVPEREVSGIKKRALNKEGWREGKGLSGTKTALQNRSDHGGRKRARNHSAAEIAGFFASAAAKKSLAASYSWE